MGCVAAKDGAEDGSEAIVVASMPYSSFDRGVGGWSFPPVAWVAGATAFLDPPCAGLSRDVEPPSALDGAGSARIAGRGHDLCDVGGVHEFDEVGDFVVDHGDEVEQFGANFGTGGGEYGDEFEVDRGAVALEGDGVDLLRAPAQAAQGIGVVAAGDDRTGGG